MRHKNYLGRKLLSLFLAFSLATTPMASVSAEEVSGNLEEQIDSAENEQVGQPVEDENAYSESQNLEGEIEEEQIQSYALGDENGNEGSAGDLEDEPVPTSEGNPSYTIEKTIELKTGDNPLKIYDNTGKYTSTTEELDQTIAQVTVEGEDLTYGDGKAISNNAEVDLKECLFTFDTTDQDGVYNISSMVGSQKVYLKPFGSNRPISTDAVGVKPVFIENKGYYLWESKPANAFLCFHTDKLYNRYSDNESGFSTKPDTIYFDLYRRAIEKKDGATTGSSEIPGYLKVVNTEDFTSGGKYLIVAHRNDGEYILRPSLDSDAKSYVAKADASKGSSSYTEGITTITFTPAAEGETSIVVGNTKYNIIVTNPAITMRREISLRVGSSVKETDLSGDYRGSYGDSICSATATCNTSEEVLGQLWGTGQYNGQFTALEDCLYTFKEKGNNTYEISGTTSDGHTVYLNFSGSNGYPNKTYLDKTVTVSSSGTSGEWKFESNGETLQLSQWNVFNADASSNSSFCLYRLPENDDEKNMASSSDIKGYVWDQTITDGKQYLIAVQQTYKTYTGKWFVLRPSLVNQTTVGANNGRNDHVALISDQFNTARTNITFEGKAVGTEKIIIGTTAYTVHVYDHPEMVTPENTIFKIDSSQTISGAKNSKLSRLTLSTNYSYQVELDVSSYPGYTVTWNTSNVNVATVQPLNSDATKAKVTGVGFGVDDCIYVTLTKDSETISYALPILVYPSNDKGGGRKIYIYVDEIVDTDAWYSLNCGNDLTEIEQYEVIYMDNNSSENWSMDFFGKPKEGYMLTKIGATGSAGLYDKVSVPVEQCEFYRSTAGRNQISAFSDEKVRKMLEAVVEVGGVGAAGFTKITTEGVTSSMSFVSRKLPEFEKTEYAVKNKNSDQLSAITDTAVVSEGDTVYFKVDVKSSNTEAEEITYSNSMIIDEMPGTYFVDKDPLDGSGVPQKRANQNVVKLWDDNKKAYSGEEASLDSCLYTFTEKEKDKYSVSSVTDNGAVYVTVTDRNFPNQAEECSVKLVKNTNGTWSFTDENNKLWFTNYNVFNTGDETDATTEFHLFKKSISSTRKPLKIEGYEEVESIVSGERYLIAVEQTNNNPKTNPYLNQWFVLHPSAAVNSSNNGDRNTHVGLVVIENENEMDITDDLNAQSEQSEDTITHSYYVAYDVKASDVGRNIINTAELKISSQSKFESSTTTSSVEAQANVQVEVKDIVTNPNDTVDLPSGIILPDGSQITQSPVQIHKTYYVRKGIQAKLDEFAGINNVDCVGSVMKITDGVNDVTERFSMGDSESDFKAMYYTGDKVGVTNYIVAYHKPGENTAWKVYAIRIVVLEDQIAGATLTVGDCIDLNYYVAIATDKDELNVNEAAKWLNTISPNENSESEQWVDKRNVANSGTIETADGELGKYEVHFLKEGEVVGTQTFDSQKNLKLRRGDGLYYYGFTYQGIHAYEMANSVTAVLYYRDGEELIELQSRDYSAKQYAENMLKRGEPSGKNLCDMLIDMLNYGASAQKYAAQEGWIDFENTLANESFSSPDSDVWFSLSRRKPSQGQSYSHSNYWDMVKSVTRESIKQQFPGQSFSNDKLYLITDQSNGVITNPKVYLKLEEGMNLSMTVEVDMVPETQKQYALDITTENAEDNLEIEGVNSRSSSSNQNSKTIRLTGEDFKLSEKGKYSVTIKGLPPFFWDNFYTLSFKETPDNAENEIYSLRYCVDSYFYDMIVDSEAEDNSLSLLLKSMFNYNQTARAWFESQEAIDDIYGAPSH